MNENGSAPTAVTLDARTLSVRELTDKVLAAFDAGHPVCVSGPEWKRPTIASVIDAICTTTGAHGQWRYVAVESPALAPAPVPVSSVLLDPPAAPDDDTEDLTDLLLLEDLARVADSERSDPWPTARDDGRGPEDREQNESQATSMDATDDSAHGDGAEQVRWPADDEADDDPDWAALAALAAEPDEQAGPDEPAPAPEPEPEPEPVLPPVRSLTGDFVAEATYSYLALLQPVMTTRLRPRPADDGVVGAASETAALAAMRDLADLTAL